MKTEDKSTIMLATALTKYINKKHNQDECIGFIDGFEAAIKMISPSYWVEYDFDNLKTRPPQPDKYLICRKDGKIHWETWNGSGWAYNSNEIKFWLFITHPIPYFNVYVDPNLTDEQIKKSSTVNEIQIKDKLGLMFQAETGNKKYSKFGIPTDNYVKWLESKIRNLEKQKNIDNFLASEINKSDDGEFNFHQHWKDENSDNYDKPMFGFKNE